MKIISVVFTILLLNAYLRVGKCIEFNRNLTTLFFSPYVKKAEGGMPIPDRDTYVFDDLFPMLELVSTKFSKLATGSAGVKDVTVKHIPNHTYHHNTFVIGRTPEAVAIFNRKTSSKNLTLLIGLALRPWNYTQAQETEVMVGIEAAEIANKIYPGTVEGFVFTKYDDMSFEWINVTLHWLRFIRRVSPSLKVGIFQECKGITSVKPANDSDNFNRLFDQQIDIIQESDFIGCDILYESQETILKFRSVIHEIKENIEVFADIGWPSDGNPLIFSVEKMVQRWSEANTFANKHTYPCWLNEAFDNPLRGIKQTSAAFRGWWKLKSNDLIRNRSGYLEKISQLVQPEMLNDIMPVNEENSKIWIYAATVVLIAGVGSLGIGWKLLLNKYKRKMSEVLLTKQEIYEFINGVSDTQVHENQLYDLVSPSAFHEPYERSLEIDKKRLQILEDVILGFGEFGCVYKAIITNEEEKQEVALKTTKENCPSTALKNLLSEIKILAYLGQHENIVSICGAYTAELESGILYVALELCTGGSLKGRLKALRSTSKADNAIQAIKDDMYRWSYEICCGMEYLGQKNVIHADLATRNILLTQNGTAKITDFGLSRRLYEYANYIKKQQEPLPWRWMALESLKLMTFSAKSDVWSYGVTLWEIFSLGSQPYSGLLWTSEFVESLEKGMRMKQPEYATGELYQTMLRCWAPEPKIRPGFSELREVVRTLDTEMEYANSMKGGTYENVSGPGQKV